jgi:hypothetical protein
MKSLTVHIGNFNGMRNGVGGFGRIQLTIGSLLDTFPKLEKLDVRIVDNESEDNSFAYLQSLKFGKLVQRKRIRTPQKWLATTINNMANLRATILSSDEKYIWNIENDSWFFGDGSFVDKAIEVLENNPDVSVVHLKRFVPLDALDAPGIPTNLSRYSEKRTSSGGSFYVLEKREGYSLWVPLKNWELGENFHPDNIAERGKCPLGETSIGGLRTVEGGYERLLTEHWNGYTSHGWIGRKTDLAFLIQKYNPLGERQMSRAFKKHFLAAKLDEDAFVDFGWGIRINPTEKEIRDSVEYARRKSSSMQEFGILNPPFEKGEVVVDEQQLNVYQ